MIARIVKRIPDESAETADSDLMLDGFPIEPSLLPQTRRLVPRHIGADLRSAYQRHLEQRIQRNPRDLNSHIRRALMYHALGDTERGFGALIDLFLILGTRGQQLRGRMLSKYREQLSPRQYNFLMSHFASGLTTAEPLPMATHSLLAKGVSGTTQIVIRQYSQGTETETPLVDARRCMADGDTAGAQAVLEAAVREDPGAADVCKELLGLYRSQDLSQAFFAIYAECFSRRLAVPALWEETERHFRRK